MCKEDVIEKIKNILARTVENGATEAEEHTAILMAQRLAAKYQINLDELDQDEQVIGEVALEFDTKTVSNIQKQIAVELQQHFGVRCILKHSATRTILFTAGEKFKCKIFKEAIQYVYNSFKFHWTRYNKTLDIPTSAKNEARGTYLRGFLSGYTQLLVEQENKYALVVVEHPELNKYIQQMAPRKSKFHLSDNGSATDFMVGYKDGLSSYKKNSQIAD